MEKVRLLIIAPSMRGGGAERFITILLKYIDRASFVPVLALIQKEGPRLVDLPADVKVVDLNAGRVRYAILKLIKLIYCERPAIILATLGHVNLALLLCRFLTPAGVKIIIRETNIPSVNLQNSLYPCLFSFMYRVLYGRADKIVCQSKDMRKDLIERFGVSRDKTVVINNPVDVDVVRMRSRGGRPILEQRRGNLLAIGKLKYQKGFDLLIEAMLHVKKKEVHLTILGEGPEMENLKKLKSDLGLSNQITLKGFVQNPYPYMAQADLVVLPSRFEGFPNVLLEAMACGKPIVAFGCPGDLNEIIKEGINGFKIDPGDIKAFAEGIENALQKKWNSGAIVDYVRKKFNVIKVVSKYEETFLNVLKGEER